MDDLIFEFLLQSGFPRASIVSDLGQVMPPGLLPEDHPSHVIVDPNTADRLAVIKLVSAVDADRLALEAGRVEQVARQIGGNTVQGFIVRYDSRGTTEAEAVQFFRVWPSRGITTLTARTFPDLDTLRVSHRLALEATRVTPEIIEPEDDPDQQDEAQPASPFVLWLPAIVVLFVCTVDWASSFYLGMTIFSLPQAVLLTGSALMFTLAFARTLPDRR